MSEFVLDASITISWFFEDEVTAFGDWVLGRLDQDSAVVPAVHWELEVAQAMLKGQRRNRMVRVAPETFQGLLRKLCIRHAVGGRGLDEVMELAAKHQLTSYDAAYLDLALRGNLPVATLDDALEAACRRENVRLLRDEHSPSTQAMFQ